MTASPAVLEAAKCQSSAESEAIIARFIESSTARPPTNAPPLEPSPCPAAGEDDLTPKAEVHRMDWAEDTSDELPAIDFNSQERSSSSSIHCTANAMVDDSEDVVAVSSFRDPDSSALPLSQSTPSSTLEQPLSEVTQLFNLIMDTIKPIQTELKRIGDKVDGRSVPPPPKQRTPGPNSTPAGSSGPRAKPIPPTIPPLPCVTPSPTQRVDDEEQEVIALISDDPDFPPLAPRNHKTRHRHSAAVAIAARNALVPGAPAPVQRNPTFGRPRAPPIFASVLTASGMGAHANAVDKAKVARDIQKRNPSGTLKPGHSVAPLRFTEVVVTRNGGLDDVEAEAAFCRKAPVDIVQAAQHALHKVSRNLPLILRGRWTENVARTGNFVYRLAGDIPLSTILACREQLCEPFPEGDVWIVPTKGWCYASLSVVRLGL
jgi:hypothetical protein